ncbi:transposase [Bacteroidia bacterium]|nr:transposase [Bacteroidia bacterium]
MHLQIKDISIMAKVVFKDYSQGQISLFPTRLDEKIPEDSPARLVNQVVDNLDIRSIMDGYQGGGCSAYHPRMIMWLSGNHIPDHNTINRFRSTHLKASIHELFTQVITLLVEMGHLSLNVVYVDGTKIESKANKYTFVWRKSVEKHKVKLEEKIRQVLQQVEEGIAGDNQADDEPPTPINSEELKKRIAAINRENRSKEEQKAIKTVEDKYLPKLEEYEKHLETLGNRNSYSKTDPAATFMRMKEDHMMNGQLKPAYNVQIGTENQFITHYDFYPNPTDYLTFKPFMNGFEKRYKKFPAKVVGDSGYGSEENYKYMEINDIEGFVKYPMFHKEQKKSFQTNAFLAQNLYYNAAKDYFVCPMGQHLENVGKGTRKSENGFVSNVSYYEAQNCEGCPLKCLCNNAKGNRRIEINHQLNAYRKKSRELLTSPEGLMHRSKRPIEPEAVFGQTKANKQYNRFRHFGGDKVKMDFAIFAIAFNLGKMHKKANNTNNPAPKRIISPKLAVLKSILDFYPQQINMAA